MTNLATPGLSPSASFGDLLTTTNNGAGLDTTLRPLQDGFGSSSTITIATTAVNFNRTGGKTFQLDGIALTASATTLNNLAGTPGNIFLANIAGAPATPVGGGILYVNAGALFYKGSSGTITPLAVA